MPQDTRISNRSIDNLILQSEWAIDDEFGMSELLKYLHELEMRNAGIPLSELGLSERRAQSMPVLMLESGAVVSGRALSDSTIEKGTIAHLRLDGVMRSQDGLSSRGIRSMADDLRAIEANPNIIGTVLEVNSGGGEEMAGRILKSVIQEVNKPVVTWFHLLGSAAVLGTIDSDRIIASGPGMEVGSIGVMASIDNKMFERIRERFSEYYAETSPAKNFEVREFKSGNDRPLIERLNRKDAQFMAAVQESRQLRGDISRVLSGALLPASEAVETGLIDSIGGLDVAVAAVREIAQQSAEKMGAQNTRIQNNQTVQIMNFSKFLASVINLMNIKFAMGIDENASAEAVQAAIEEAPSLDDIRASVAQSVREELAAENETALAELRAELTAMRETAAEQAKELETLRQSRTEIEAELVELKGRAANSAAGNINASTPRVDQFKTVQAWEKAKPGAGSKY